MAVLAATGVAGCGSAQPPAASHVPLAQRVCRAVAVAAAAVTRAPAPLQITSSDPSDMRCVIRSAGARFDLDDQPSTQAWVEFGTTQVHFAQVYGASAVHDAAKMPGLVLVRGHTQLDWVPGQRELFGTDGTDSRGGSYVTVDVTGRAAGQVKAATAMALAALRHGPPEPKIVAPS